jgi:hypothetical protein
MALATVAARMARRRAREARRRIDLVKRPRTRLPAEAPVQARGRRPRPDVVHSSLYLPEAVHDALREAAFKERRKIHDIVLEGIELVLKKRGYPSMDASKPGKRPVGK